MGCYRGWCRFPAPHPDNLPPNWLKPPSSLSHSQVVHADNLRRQKLWRARAIRDRSCQVPERFETRVAQNARGVVKGAVKGVTRASFGRRAPLTTQLKRASTRRREEEVFRGVHMIQQVAAVHLGLGQAPSLDTKLRYESARWVLLERYGEYSGCYLGRRAGVLAA